MVLRNFYIAGAVVVWVILLFFIGVIIYNGLAIQLEVRPDYFKITYLIPYKTITIAYRDIKATRNYRSDESSRGNDRRSVLTEEIETEEELISFTNLQFSNYQRLKAAIYSRTTAAKGQHQH